MTVMIRAIKQCHLGVSEFYHSQSFKYAARNLPKVSSMQRDPYATANLLETISKDIIILFITCQQPILNSESTNFSFHRFFNELEVFDFDQMARKCQYIHRTVFILQKKPQFAALSKKW